MAYEDTYQRRSRPVPRSRNRPKQGRLPKPVVRIGGFVLVFAALLVLIIFSARACARSGESGAYQTYIAGVQKIVTASDDIGGQLTALLTNPGDISRADVQTKLEGFVAQCDSLEQQARGLKTPKSLLQGTAQQMFVLVMYFRSTGVSDLKTYLLSALELEDTTGAAVTPVTGPATTATTALATTSEQGSMEQIINSLRFLTTSDFLYREVYEIEVAKVLTQRSIGGVTVPSSQFIDDPEIASTDRVNQIVDAMKTTGNLQAVHGVAFAGVLAMPDNKQLVDGGTYDLTQVAGLAFVVTVENQGTMDETDVPVEVDLVSKSSPQQIVKAQIATLKAKATQTVTVEGLSPTAYGEVGTLTVKVGPVKDERYISNNNMTAKVIFK